MVNNFTRIFEINIFIKPFFYEKISKAWDYAASTNFILRTFINFFSIWSVYFLVFTTSFLVFLYIKMLKNIDFYHFKRIFWYPVRSAFRLFAILYIFIQMLPVIVNTLIYLQTRDKTWSFLYKNWASLYHFYTLNFTIFGIGFFMILNYIIYTAFSTTINITTLIKWKHNKSRLRDKYWKLLIVAGWINLWTLFLALFLTTFIIGTPTLIWKKCLKFSLLKNYLPWLSKYSTLPSHWVYITTYLSLVMLFGLNHLNIGVYNNLILLELFKKSIYPKYIHWRFLYIIFFGFFLGDFFITFGVIELFNQISCVVNNSGNKVINAGFSETNLYYQNLFYIESFSLICFSFLGFSFLGFFIFLIWELFFGWWGMSIYNYFKVSCFSFLYLFF
ncbi:hypothetical protein SGLAD_v1c03150 [Spiroplasma gladiatoris]|uniref:Transmembrane protein n=1 Tax=Spiroplasma gladiatoris TaxID=2143 RepID=A0A4P7AGJ5_9MOLU|nr:hypothetical protein [Spiroplasma gladiatoris]QBQ07514.1 hypothetical protein SGLAD_v1c03150 [Spiroplasma gladiatoris]